MEELQKLLEGMDIPGMRKNDLHWLLRNLGIRNVNHPDFAPAMQLIKKLLLAK